MRKFIRNREGTAEIIGSVMFIVILLFFFTNVYLWHDAATKNMNSLYVERMNSPITVSVVLDANNVATALNVTNKGGVDATLSRLWIDLKSQSQAGGPDQKHLGGFPIDGKVVRAGGSATILLAQFVTPSVLASNNIQFKVITTLGNSAACDYAHP